MITAIVRFKLPEGVTLEQATAKFQESAPRFRAAPGLVRKYYLFGEDGTGGGVYLWENRAAAEAMYTEEWRRSIVERFGAEPEVSYFESPVIVDNVVGEIAVEQAA